MRLGAALGPLWGGGYWVALRQAAAVYYAAAVVLHYVAPTLLPVRSVQKGQPRQGQVTREALTSLGASVAVAGRCRRGCARRHVGAAA